MYIINFFRSIQFQYLIIVKLYFNNSKNLEYVNLKGAMIGQSLSFFEKCNNNPPNLTICSDNEEFGTIINSSKKENIKCINNIFLIDINNNANIKQCFKNNNIELNNPCKICGKDYSKIINNNNNITDIICYENKEGYYFDNISLHYSSCYISCKKCNIS